MCPDWDFVRARLATSYDEVASLGLRVPAWRLLLPYLGLRAPDWQLSCPDWDQRIIFRINKFSDRRILLLFVF